MSIQAINWALEQPGTPTQKHVLLVLANYANEGGIAFPSNVLLAQATGLNEKSIRRAKASLIDAGLVELSGQKGARFLRLRLDAVIPKKDTESRSKDAKSNKPDTKSTSNKLDSLSPHVDFKSQQKDTESTPYNHQLTTTNHHTPYSPPKTSKPVPKAKESFDLPDWIPVEAWNGWLEMRRSVKKPATTRAMAIAVKKLTTLKAQGHDPCEVLDTSTLHGWQGLFPLKNQRGSGGGESRMSETERNRQTIFDEMKTHYGTQSNDMQEGIIFQ